MLLSHGAAAVLFSVIHQSIVLLKQCILWSQFIVVPSFVNDRQSCVVAEALVKTNMEWVEIRVDG